MKTAKQQLNGVINLPPRSVWSASAGVKESRPALSGDRQTTVLIVGAGLAGILTGWRLKQAGIPCIIAEAKQVGSGVTQNTTAKITAQHGLIYNQLRRRFGHEKMLLYYQANMQAIEDYRHLAVSYPCHFEEQTAYVYSLNDRSKLEREAAAYDQLGIRSNIVEAAGLPFPAAGAVAMENQAQFNPLKLLTALSDSLDIVENTFIRTIEDGFALTDNGRIKADHIILATHFPLINIPGLFFLKLYQHRSYVLALKGAPLPDGMYVDEQQGGCSFRSYEDLLLFGGGDHKTGCPGGCYKELFNLASVFYPQSQIQYRWATQDCMSLDGVPYIGRHHAAAKNLYVATGFNKWGMTGSMVASRLLCDLIIDGRSELEDLYSPRRSIWTRQLAVNTGQAALNLLSVGGPRCPHMGCRLRHNPAEGTWDCPCHGSRFDAAGKLINNPAKRRLKA